MSVVRAADLHVSPMETLALTEQQHVVVNVGGRRFETLRNTLLQIGGQFFRSALQRLPENGVLFLDRDPDRFAVVLNFLRTGRVALVPGVSVKDVIEEAAFLQIEPLQQLAVEHVTVTVEPMNYASFLRSAQGEEKLGGVADGYAKVSSLQTSGWTLNSTDYSNNNYNMVSWNLSRVVVLDRNAGL